MPKASNQTFSTCSTAYGRAVVGGSRVSVRSSGTIRKVPWVVNAACLYKVTKTSTKIGLLGYVPSRTAALPPRPSYPPLSQHQITQDGGSVIPTHGATLTYTVLCARTIIVHTSSVLLLSRDSFVLIVYDYKFTVHFFHDFS